MRCLWNGLRTFARHCAGRLSELPSRRPAPPIPRYLVRACRYSDSVNLLREVERAPTPWPPELLDLVLDCFFQGDASELSVFSAETADCFDHGHALGVVARVIATNDFDPAQRERYDRQVLNWAAKATKNAARPVAPGAKLFTFAIPATVFTESGAAVNFSPENNLNFAPADEHHYDVSFPDPTRIAGLLLDGLQVGRIRWACVHKEDLRCLAAAALSTCVRVFGDLSTGVVPTGWRAGTLLDAGEQLARLRHLAGQRMLSTPPPAA